ncbi:MAG TPA: 4Fe-4S binding protein, partial [bacterium]|nr:4Fe-4S binding protein [bacterium]
IDEKVLLCGDAKNGATSVIEAVSDGRKLALSFCMSNDELAFYSERQKGILVNDLSSYVSLKSHEAIHRLPEKRIKDFSEAELGFTELTCTKEAERCLDCGCSSIQDCSLRELSLEYKAEPYKFKVNGSTGGEKHFIDDSIGLFTYEASKCIKCGTCVRVCDKVAGVKAISFMGRGFDSKIASAPKSDINSSTCILCGMCIDSCPTGALVEHISDFKREQLKEEVRECDQCILKCKLLCVLDDKGTVIRARSYDTPICSIGRWGRGHYRGKTSNRTVDLSDLNVSGIEVLSKATSVLCLNYDPYKDNPRMAYELNKLSPEILNSKDASQTVVIFNYFDPPTKHELKTAFAIIPVYYSGS